MKTESNLSKEQLAGSCIPRKSTVSRWAWLAGGVLVAGGLGFALVFWRTASRERVAAKRFEGKGGLITTVSVTASNTTEASHGQEEASPAKISTPASVAKAAPQPAAPSGKDDGFTPVHFVVLAGFNYAVRYVVPEDHPEQALLRALDTIPPDIQAYDGRRVKITGFVMPLRVQRRGLTEFLLVRDQLSCCFGPAAQMNHWVHVTIERGEFRPAMYLPVTVYGTLHVGERYVNNSLLSIYRMDAERVEEAELKKRPQPPDWVNGLSAPEGTSTNENQARSP